MKTLKILGASAAMAIAFSAAPASAGTCIGNCGTSGADGDIGLSPTGNPSYSYVSTWDGSPTTAGEIASVGDNDGGPNTGSQFTTSLFSAAAGDSLAFYFNYITSDGAGFADYGWAELVDSMGAHVAWLFTGRTQASGDIAPGFGLPALDATLTPATSPIIGGAPDWSLLGGDNNSCYAAGCGYTGWIESTYTIASAGTYAVVFGVTNWSDSAYASGLAWDGLALNDTSITGGGVGAVPEPATWAMLLLGFFAMGGLLRRQRQVAHTMAVTYS